MTLNEAAKLLTLTLPTSYDTVQAAFRAKAKSDHPDAGGDGTKLTAYKQARDILVNHTRGVKPPCSVCGGGGVVRSKGFKLVPCPKGCKAPTLTRPPARRKS